MKGFLDEVNRMNGSITEFSLKYSPIIFPVYIAMIALVNVVYCFLKYGYISSDHLYYPARYVYVHRNVVILYKIYNNGSVFISSLPWNQETVFGWIGLLIFVMLGSVTYFYLNSLFLLLFSSICNFHKAFKMNTKHLLEKLDVLTDVRPSTPANRKEIPLILCEIIKNNIKGKE